jgi:hypothetical protein
MKMMEVSPQVDPLGLVAEHDCRNEKPGSTGKPGDASSETFNDRHSNSNTFNTSNAEVQSYGKLP